MKHYYQQLLKNMQLEAMWEPKKLFILGCPDHLYDYLTSLPNTLPNVSIVRIKKRSTHEQGYALLPQNYLSELRDDRDDAYARTTEALRIHSVPDSPVCAKTA